MATATLKFLLPGPQATKAAGAVLAEWLAGAAPVPALVTLEGPLGAGKTTFAQGFGEALGLAPGEVASPTFTLADVHTGGREILNHLDLYRLGGGGAPEDALKEFLEAGLDERLDEGLTLVEWPERLPEGYWPEGRVTVRFIMLVSGRVMEVSLPYPGAGPDTAERLTGALRARGIAPYAPGSPGAPRACGS